MVKIINHLLTRFVSSRIPKGQVLTALLIPTSLIGKEASPQTIESVAAPFVEQVASSVNAIYGPPSSRKYGPDDHGILGAVFVLEEAVITYYLCPSNEQNRQRDPKPTLYLGTLEIRQEHLDYTHAGHLISLLLPHALVAYNTKESTQPSFLIYHDQIFADESSRTITKGKELLEKLGVSISTACMYADSPHPLMWEIIKKLC